MIVLYERSVPAVLGWLVLALLPGDQRLVIHGGHACHPAPGRPLHVFIMDLLQGAQIDAANDHQEETDGRPDHEFGAVLVLFDAAGAGVRHLEGRVGAAVGFAVVDAWRWVLLVVGALLEAFGDGEVEEAGSGAEEEDRED